MLCFVCVMQCASSPPPPGPALLHQDEPLHQLHGGGACPPAAHCHQEPCLHQDPVTHGAAGILRVSGLGEGDTKKRRNTGLRRFHNHGEDPYEGLLLVESGYYHYRFCI